MISDQRISLSTAGFPSAVAILILTAGCVLNRHLKEGDSQLPALTVPADYYGITNAPPIR